MNLTKNKVTDYVDDSGKRDVRVYANTNDKFKNLMSVDKLIDMTKDKEKEK